MSYKIIRASTIPQSLNNFCRGELKYLGQKYEIIALSSPGRDLLEIEQRERVRTIAVPMERHVSLFKDMVSLCRMVKVMMKEKPYMVHSMTPKAGLLCMVAAWLARVPIRVHTFTGLVFPTTRGLLRRILMLTDSITCYCATHVIPEGEGVKNDLTSHRITNKPLRVLGYGNGRGVDMEYYSRRKEVMTIAKELRDVSFFTFLFVGRIVGDKGVNELCDAFIHLHQHYPQTRLWLVGRFEEKLDPVNQKTRTMISNPGSGIEAIEEKRGDELLAYYASSDCFVMPSYREGFPNTVLEAGAMGLPSIVTDVNGSREIIIEGRNGTIVPSKNSQALFDAMKRMIDNISWRKTMIRNARRMVGERFEQGFVRQCLYDFYDEILNDKISI